MVDVYQFTLDIPPLETLMILFLIRFRRMDVSVIEHPLPSRNCQLAVS